MKRAIIVLFALGLAVEARAQAPAPETVSPEADTLQETPARPAAPGAQDGAPAPPKRKPAPQGARAYIIWPRDGTVIKGGKFWLRMGLQGAGVAPASIDRPNTGHHHVLVNTDVPPLDEPIPNDAKHLHFGGGQTEVRMELPPGRHTLQLLLGDLDHVPHDPPIMSQRITVIVQ